MKRKFLIELFASDSVTNEMEVRRRSGFLTGVRTSLCIRECAVDTGVSRIYGCQSGFRKIHGSFEVNLAKEKKNRQVSWHLRHLGECSFRCNIGLVYGGFPRNRQTMLWINLKTQDLLHSNNTAVLLRRDFVNYAFGWSYYNDFIFYSLCSGISSLQYFA